MEAICGAPPKATLLTYPDPSRLKGAEPHIPQWSQLNNMWSQTVQGTFPGHGPQAGVQPRIGLAGAGLNQDQGQGMPGVGGQSQLGQQQAQQMVGAMGVAVGAGGGAAGAGGAYLPPTGDDSVPASSDGTGAAGAAGGAAGAGGAYPPPTGDDSVPASSSGAAAGGAAGAARLAGAVQGAVGGAGGAAGGAAGAGGSYPPPTGDDSQPAASY